MRKPSLPLLLFAATVATTATYVVAGKPLPFVEPHVAVTAPRTNYALGEPIPITYRVVNAPAIPMTPTYGCSFGGEYDMGAEVVVRAADGTELAPPPRHVCLSDGRAMQGDWSNPLTPPGVLNVNDMVTISRPGDYVVTVRVHVMRPASRLRELVSNAVTIRISDTPAARAKRQERVAFAASVMRNPDASAQTKTAAINALLYNSEPGALPLLLDAYNSPDSDIVQAAHVPLALWYDPQAAHNAACAWLKSRFRAKQAVRENAWEKLLMDYEHRARLRDYIDAKTDSEAWERAAKTLRNLQASSEK